MRTLFDLLDFAYQLGKYRPKPLAERQKRVLEFRRKGLTPSKRIRVALKAAAGQGRRLAGVASSTAEDLDGDVISPALLRRMSRDIVELPLFSDHHYTVGTVLGKVVSAQVVDRAGVTDLDVVVELLPEGDPGADKVWALAQNNVPIGLSVGIQVIDYRQRPGGTRGIELLDGEVVDLSVVGIPAQRRSRRLVPVK